MTFLVYSECVEEDESHLSLELQTLKDHQLVVKLNKCKFWLDEVRLLSHVICKNGVTVDPSKIEVILVWQRPTFVQEVTSFLGLASSCRRFAKGFSRLLSSLTSLTRKNVKFAWIDK